MFYQCDKCDYSSVSDNGCWAKNCVNGSAFTPKKLKSTTNTITNLASTTRKKIYCPHCGKDLTELLQYFNIH